jgi:hypothetical protein
MKLSVTVAGLASLSRLDTSPLLSRLRAELERELQSGSTSDMPLDSAARQTALARALRNVGGAEPSPLPSGERT